VSPTALAVADILALIECCRECSQEARSLSKREYLNRKQRLLLSARLTVSYLGGILAGSLLLMNSVFGIQVFVLYGLLFSWPLYVTMIVIAFIFAGQIAIRPALWTGLAILIVPVASFLSLPSDGYVKSMASVGAICAAFSGGIFYCLNRSSPILQDLN
jgi:hypothetical protein